MSTIIRKDTILYINGIKCRCNSVNITVYESYNIENIEEFVDKLRIELAVHNETYTRSRESWIREIYAHNILYKKNICITSTKDTDITDKEEWYRLLFFDIIYYLYKLKHKISNLFK